MPDGSTGAATRLSRRAVPAAFAVAGCVLVTLAWFGPACAVFIAAMLAVVWRFGSAGEAVRFSLRAVLLAVSLFPFQFVVRLLWAVRAPSFPWFGFVYVALVALMVIVWRIVTRRSDRNGDQRPPGHREMAVLDRILLGIVIGEFIGAGVALLHAVLHVPPRIPSEPLRHEWWTPLALFCIVASAGCGILIGILLAVMPGGRRWRSSASAIGGAAAGLLVSYHLARVPGAGGFNLPWGCLSSLFGAVVAAAAVLLRGRARVSEP